MRFVLCVPQNRPRPGLVIYDDAVFDAAQVRVDLALGVRAHRGHRGDRRGRRSRPVHRHDGRGARVPPRRDHRLDLSGDALGLAAPRPGRATAPGHGTARRARRRRPRHRGSPLPRHARRGQPHGQRRRAVRGAQGPGRGRDGSAQAAVRRRRAAGGRRRITPSRRPAPGCKLVLDRLHAAGLLAAGTIGDPDPYTAIDERAAVLPGRRHRHLDAGRRRSRAGCART